MTFPKLIPSILACFFIVGCVAGPPRYLTDEEVTWIEIANVNPVDARERVLNSIEAIRYSCKKTEYRADLLFKCGKGQTINYMRQVKGLCRVAPDKTFNSLCEIHVLQVDRRNGAGPPYSQPESVRAKIDASIIADTNAKRIDRPVKSNSFFREDRGTPLTNEPLPEG